MDELVELTELTMNGDFDECLHRLRERPDPAHDAAMLALMFGFMLTNSARRQGFTADEVLQGFREEIVQNLR